MAYLGSEAQVIGSHDIFFQQGSVFRNINLAVWAQCVGAGGVRETRGRETREEATVIVFVMSVHFKKYSSCAGKR